MICIYVMNEIDTVLQLLSFRWPLLLPSSFQEDYFNHTLTCFQVGVCYSVTSLQNTHTVAVPDIYSFHSISILLRKY
jgi:hypothetical protein